MEKKSRRHPGFAAVQKKIEGDGYSKEVLHFRSSPSRHGKRRGRPRKRILALKDRSVADKVRQGMRRMGKPNNEWNDAIEAAAQIAEATGGYPMLTLGDCGCGQDIAEKIRASKKTGG